MEFNNEGNHFLYDIFKTASLLLAIDCMKSSTIYILINKSPVHWLPLHVYTYVCKSNFMFVH